MLAQLNKASFAPFQRQYQPPEAVQLNPRNRYAEHLTAAWLPPQMLTTTTDLVRNRVPRNPSIGYYDMTANVTPSVLSIQPSTEGLVLDRSSSTGTERMLLNNTLVIGTTFTIFARLFIRSVTTYGALLTFDSATGLFIRNSSGLKLNWFASGDHLGASVIPTNTWTDVMISLTGGNVAYYINAIKDANTFSGLSATNLSGSLSDSGSEAINGQVACLYVFGGAATFVPFGIPDMIELMADPYQMFAPADFVGGRAAGGTTTVTAGVTVPVEWLGTARAGSTIPLEWLLTAASALSLPAEWLGSAVASGSLPVEWVGAAQSGQTLPAEWTQGILGNQIAVAEWLSSASQGLILPAEWLATIVGLGIIPVEWTGVGTDPEAVFTLGPRGDVFLLSARGDVFRIPGPSGR